MKRGHKALNETKEQGQGSGGLARDLLIS